MAISEQEKKILRTFSSKIPRDDPGAHNNLGVVYFNKGLIEEAVEEFKKALEIEPRFALAKNNINYIYRNTGYYDENIEKLKGKLKENPDDSRARLELARAYKSTGNYYEALNNYHYYIKGDAKNTEVLMEMGICSKSLGFYEAAVELFGRAIRIDDSLGQAHKYLGEVYYNLGLFSRAITELRRAIELEPEDAESYYFLSFAYGEEGRFEEAKEATGKAIKLNPQYGRAEPNLGLEVYQQKGYEEFLSVPKEKIEEKPFFGYYAMGLSYKNKGLFEESLSEFRKAAEIDPDNVLVKVQIGEVYLFQGKNRNAINYYSEAYKKDPDSLRIINNIGIAYHRMGELEEAIQWYEKALSKNEDYEVAWNNFGVANYHSGYPQRAIKCFKRAYKLNYDYPDPLLNLGQIWMTRGEYQKAEKFFKKVLKMKEDYPLPYNYLGSVYLNTGIFDKAIHLFREAINKDRQFAEAYYNLGFALSRIGRYDEALEATKKAMEINPFYTSNRFKLGLDIYSEKLDILVARELTKEMDFGGEVKEESKDSEEEIFDGLFEPEVEVKEEYRIEEKIEKASSMYKNGQINESLSLLEEIRQHESNNPDVLLLMGKIYRERGLLGEAKDVLLNIIPDNLEAVKVISGVYLENEEWEKAEEMAELLRDREPSETISYIISARYFLNNDKSEKAIEVLKNCPDWKKVPEIVSEIAGIYYGEKDFKKSFEWAKKSTRLSPADENYLLMAKIKIREKNYREALKYLGKGLNLNSKNKEILKLLLKVKFYLKDYKGVLKTAMDAKKIIRADSEIALWVGKSFYRMGKMKDAIESLKKAISFDRNNIDAYQVLASIYLNSGNIDRSQESWQEVIARAEDEKTKKKAQEAIKSIERLKTITGDI